MISSIKNFVLILNQNLLINIDRFDIDINFNINYCYQYNLEIKAE